MADTVYTKYIDEEALKAVIKNIKSADAATLSSAKTYVGAIPEDQKDNYDDVVSYLESLISDSSSNGEVTMEEATTGLADNVLKSYTFYQGVNADDTDEQKAAKKIGTINLAKDLVVTSGEVVKLEANTVETKPADAEAGTAAEYLEAGTYLKLTIANQTAPVYINVLDLVNDFTVAANADEIQLAISDTREISASIVDASISRDKIDTDFEANIAAIEAAIGSKDDALVSVTNRIKDEAAEAIYKAAVEAQGTEGEDGYVPAQEAITIAQAIAALESSSADTNGAFVYKGEVASTSAIPTDTAKKGDAYLVTDTNTLYLAIADKTFDPIAVYDSFTVNSKAVSIKNYIDSRIFVGTTEEVEAAKTAGTIDDTTFIVVVDEDAQGFKPITEAEVDELFAAED